MAPELPVTFSTTTAWPQASVNLWANMRAVTSVALPAVKPTTSLTGLSGHLVCAASGVTRPNTSTSAATDRTIDCMVSSGKAISVAVCQRLWDFGAVPHPRSRATRVGAKFEFARDRIRDLARRPADIHDDRTFV